MSHQSTSAPASFGAAWSRLKRIQRDASGAPAYSRFVNRPVGRILAAAAFRAGLYPNQVTAVSAVFTFAGLLVLAMAQPTWVTGVLVALALMVGYALDSADGQLARLRGGGTAVGEWLDHMIDAAKLASIHLAVLITVALHFGFQSQVLLLIPLGFAAVQMVQFFGMILTDLIARERHAITAPGSAFTPPQRAGANRSTLMTVARIPVDYGLTCLIFFCLGAHTLFFLLYSFTAVAWGLYLLLAVRRWYRLMRALDRNADRA